VSSCPSLLYSYSSMGSKHSMRPQPGTLSTERR
jgi:hypothetical protein